MANEVCFRTLHKDRPWRLETYQSDGGYEALKKILNEKVAQEEIIEAVKSPVCAGAAAAGFRPDSNWSFINRTAPGDRYVVCNSDEGEPGTFKDRDILRYNLHALIEGHDHLWLRDRCRGQLHNYIRGEVLGASTSRFEEALAETREAGLLGENILGSGFDFDIHSHLGAGAYICSEETALLGIHRRQKGQLRLPPFPAMFLYGRPTVINNRDSRLVPDILRQAGLVPRDQRGPTSGGPKLFSISGNVTCPGNYEIPMGTPFAELLEMAGGMRDGRPCKAVIPGGSSAPVLPGDVMMDLTMDYDSIAKGRFNAGLWCRHRDGRHQLHGQRCSTAFRISTTRNPVGSARPVAGTGWMHRVVHRIETGKGLQEDLDLLDDVAKKIMGAQSVRWVTRRRCRWPGSSGIFPRRVQYHIDNKLHGVSPCPTIKPSPPGVDGKRLAASPARC